MWKVHLLRCEILFSHFSSSTSVPVFPSRSFTLLHSVFLLYGSEKWSLVINFPTCGTSEKEWQFWWFWFLSSFFSFFLIILSQKADVGVEEVSGCVQPRGTMWANPSYPQSPRVHLQVHRPLAHALLPVSVCATFCGVIIMIITFWTSSIARVIVFDSSVRNSCANKY